MMEFKNDVLDSWGKNKLMKAKRLYGVQRMRYAITINRAWRFVFCLATEIVCRAISPSLASVLILLFLDDEIISRSQSSANETRGVWLKFKSLQLLE